MKTTNKILFMSFMFIISGGIMAQTDLLSVSSEDGNFTEYDQTENQIWPPRYPAAPNSWFADGVLGGTRTSVRNHNVEPEALTPAVKNYHSKYHYIQLLMDNGTLGSNYMWRKISGLTSGATYTFSFYYRMPWTVANHHIKFAVINDVANIKVNPSNNNLNTIEGELGSAHLELDTPSDSTNFYRKGSYTFTVPAGETVVYAAWVRNITVPTEPVQNYRIFLDDMSLYITPPALSTDIAGDELPGFNYNINVSAGPSAEQTIKVAGQYLKGDVTVTPPPNYEVSTTSGSNFSGSPLVLVSENGMLAEISVYVRLIADLSVGTYDGNLTVASTDADSKIIALSGQVADTTTDMNVIKIFKSMRVVDGNLEFVASGNERITVYNVIGQQIVNSLSVEGRNVIAIESRGIIIVKAGNQVTKMLVD